MLRWGIISPPLGANWHSVALAFDRFVWHNYCAEWIGPKKESTIEFSEREREREREKEQLLK